MAAGLPKGARPSQGPRPTWTRAERREERPLRFPCCPPVTYQPATAAEPGAAELRLPATRYSDGRAGLFDDQGPAGTVELLIECLRRGDVGALPPLLSEDARGRLEALARERGPARLGEILRRRCRAICDARLERIIEREDDLVECRLRVFRLQPGGQIRICLWLVEARLVGGFWRISSFDPLNLIRPGP